MLSAYGLLLALPPAGSLISAWRHQWLRAGREPPKGLSHLPPEPQGWTPTDFQLWRWLWLAARVAVGALAAVAVAELVLMEPGGAVLLSPLWASVRGARFCHWNMAEAVFSTSCFALYINGFHFLDCLAVLARYRLKSRTSSKGFMPSPADWASFSGRDHNNGVKLRAGAYYLLGVWLWHTLIRGDKRPLEIEAPTLARFIVEVAIGIWLYDFIFFWVHLTLHKVPKGLRRVLGHSIHHDQETLKSEDTLKHSFLDAFMQVVVNIAVQQCSPWGFKHALSKFAHNAAITFLLTEIHSGYDAPWSLHRLFPNMYGGVWRHELHHTYGTCCYHEFFTYMDDFFGYGPNARKSSD